MIGLGLTRAPSVLAAGSAGLAAALLLIQPAVAEPAIRAEYRCGATGEERLATALFFPLEPRQVVLIVDGQAERLLQARSASGARYSSQGQEFWVKGREASWIRSAATSEQPLRCVVTPASP